MTTTFSIPGPLGPFFIPAEPARTREVCEFLSKQVFDGEYEIPDVRPLVDDAGPRPLTVLDIGAAWGAFSVWAAKRWPGCFIHAYEPHDEAFAFLMTNARKVLSTANMVAVTVDPAALYDCGEDWGAGRTKDMKQGKRVPSIHPNTLPPCDILKCDAEGVEVEVLEHYPHLDDVQALLLEFHDLEKKYALRQLAQAADFELVREEQHRTYGVSIWTRTPPSVALPPTF